MKSQSSKQTHSIRRMAQSVSLFMLLGCFGWLGSSERSQATDPPPAALPPNSLPAVPPLDTSALLPGQTPPGVVTATTISPTHLTIPSLWWVQEQIEYIRRTLLREAILAQLKSQKSAQDKDAKELAAQVEQLEKQQFRILLTNWLAYPLANETPGRIDLIVDRQVWGGLDYLQRYEFVNRFSTIARSYGYNIRVFDSQATIVGAFTCQFNATDLRLFQLSNQLAQTPGVRPDLVNYSRNPISDQLNCTMAIETGISAFLRRTSTPSQY